MTDIKPRGLIVMPYVDTLQVAIDRTKKTDANPLLWVMLGETETRFSIEPTATEILGQPQAPPDEAADESPLTMNLFWKIYRTTAGDDEGRLILMHAELAVPTHLGLQVKDAAVRASGKRATGTVTMRVPFLTNKDELRRGDALWYCKP